MFEYLKPRNAPVVDGLESQEVVYAENQPQYIPLRTLCANGEMGAVLSREAVAAGADIFLELSTFHETLQPIRMAISDAI